MLMMVKKYCDPLNHIVVVKTLVLLSCFFAFFLIAFVYFLVSSSPIRHAMRKGLHTAWLHVRFDVNQVFE